MLGERQSGPVTQAAFIRSLIASYVKRARGRGVSIGGLFGEELHVGEQDVLNWNRPQQAAFLIFVWQIISNAIQECDEKWANMLRDIPRQEELPLEPDKTKLDPAFTSEYSLLATDQGVRGILYLTNDMCFVAADELKLANWDWKEEIEEDLIDPQDVSDALRQLENQPVGEYLKLIVRKLCEFTWLTSSTPGLTDEERQAQMVFRGSGGYKELRRQLLQLLISSDDKKIRTRAQEVADRLGYGL